MTLNDLKSLLQMVLNHDIMLVIQITSQFQIQIPQKVITLIIRFEIWTIQNLH